MTTCRTANAAAVVRLLLLCSFCAAAALACDPAINLSLSLSLSATAVSRWRQVRVHRLRRSRPLGRPEPQLQAVRERDEAVPDRHRHGPGGLQPGAAAAPQGLHRGQRHPRRQRRQRRAALRRRRRSRERERRREAVQAEAGALALAFRAHRRRPPVPRRAPHGPRQRRRQRHRGGHALPVWQAGSFALADPGQAGRAARGGLQSGKGRSGRRRRRQPVVAQALLPHVLPLRRVVHHAALHRERHLERPGPGEGDDGGPGRRPDGAPGASLQAQQQADAAEERPRRPGLPQRVHQQEDGAVAVPCPVCGLVLGGDAKSSGLLVNCFSSKSFAFCTRGGSSRQWVCGFS